MAEKQKSQIDKFKDAARELGTDDDPERFAEAVKKLAKATPARMPPKSGKAKGDNKSDNG